MAIELLGPSVDTTMGLCGGQFEFPTVMMLAEQMITRVETLHNKGFLHRDIKPENFSLGKGKKSNTIFIIDYGLVKRYRNAKTKVHIEFKKNKKLAGTARYVSINTHMGYEQGRRDDMECLAYSFIYMAKGELPWQGMRAKDKEDKYKKIYKMKSEMPLELLCNGLPNEFMKYIKYCRTLEFEDKPDYQELKLLFRNGVEKYKHSVNPIFDWIMLGVDLNTYKKPIVNLRMEKKIEFNISSSKAEGGNHEDALGKAKSKEAQKTGLEEEKNRSVHQLLEVPDKKSHHGNYLNVGHGGNNKAITENTSKSGSFIEKNNEMPFPMNSRGDETRKFKDLEREDQKTEVALLPLRRMDYKQNITGFDLKSAEKDKNKMNSSFNNIEDDLEEINASNLIFNE